MSTVESTDISSDDCECAPESEEESYESTTELAERLARLELANKSLQQELTNALAQVALSQQRVKE